MPASMQALRMAGTAMRDPWSVTLMAFCPSSTARAT